MRQLRQFLHDHRPEESVLTLLMITAVVVLVGAGMWRLIDGGGSSPKTEVRAAEVRNDTPDSDTGSISEDSPSDPASGSSATDAGAISESDKPSRSTTTTTKRRAAALALAAPGSTGGSSSTTPGRTTPTLPPPSHTTSSTTRPTLPPTTSTSTTSSTTTATSPPTTIPTVKPR